jgi:hypothetical protein
MVICASGAVGEADRTGWISYSQNSSRTNRAMGRRGLCHLFLEEVLEGLAGVVVARRGRRGGGSSLLRVGGGRSVFFDRGAEFVEGAVVLRVLGSDALGNGLGAFKLRAAVEEAALFATVQLEIALGALAVRVKAAGEHGAAIGTARAGHGANHARGARAELIGARTALRRLAVVRPFLLVLLFRVAIPAVTILSIHKPSYNMPTRRQTRAPAALGRAKTRPYNCRGRQAKARLYNATDLYPIGLLHSTVTAIFPRVYRTGLPTV